MIGDGYKEQYMAASRRIAELEQQVASLNGALSEAQRALAASREEMIQASDIRQTEIESLRQDLVEAQQKILTSALTGASQSTVDALKVEIEAYKADNTMFLQALQQAADCSKSQAQQIAAAALGQPTD